MQEDLRHHVEPEMEDDFVHKHRRDSLARRLSRLKPGGSTAMAALLTPTGEIVTQPAAMAAALREHWATVFARRPTDSTMRSNWLAEELMDTVISHFTQLPSASWRARREDLRGAVSGTPLCSRARWCSLLGLACLGRPRSRGTVVGGRGLGVRGVARASPSTDGPATGRLP